MDRIVKRNTSLTLIGGIVAGVAASACCIGPLVLLMLGISGTWIGSLTALESYRPIFIGMSLVFVVFAYREIYVRKVEECRDEGTVCAVPRTQQIYRFLFWVVLGFIALALISPYLAPLFY